MNVPVCSMCGEKAFVECFLYDVYLEMPDVLMEQDFTCPYLCERHFVENEAEAYSEVGASELSVTVAQIADQYDQGVKRMDFAISLAAHGGEARSANEIVSDIEGGRKIPVLRDHRGSPTHPYTNQQKGQGLTIYKRLFEE